ncbi:MAG TPA: HAD hydrolase-like protein, partial [Nitrolancea sp.]|nr:HAD hydrolase-like protein [Nitrolancea sp.]
MVTVATASDLETALERARGYEIDMDGVLYRGDAGLPYVNDFLQALDRCRIPYVLATNNSTRSPEQYVEKLAKMGVRVEADRILTSGQATAARMKAKYPRGTTVYVLGMQALEEAVFGDGYFEPATTNAEVVVSGADFELTYDKLRIATLAIRSGAGSILAALVAATSVEPEVIGKPSTGMLVQGAALLGTAPAETVMLGDRLDTDILAGKRAGFITLLVLTGVSTLEELESSEVQPDVVVPDLAPL